MKNKLLSKQIIIGTILFIIFFAIFYSSAIILGPNGDILGHAWITEKMIETGDYFKGTFILYLLASILSFFSTDTDRIIISICIILAGAIIFRFFIVQKRFYNMDLNKDSNKSYWLSVALGLSMLFVFGIPLINFITKGWMYLGTLTANVWHNSTTILLFPFAILLFSETSKQLKDYSSKRNLIIIALIFVNIFIKPNFFFAFACVYPLMMLYKYRFNKAFWTSLIPLVFGCIFLFVEYLGIYISDVPHDVSDEEKSSIGFCFMCSFRIWGNYLDFPVTIIFSMLFPIVYSIWNRKQLKGDLSFWYTIWLVLSALLIYIFVIERGPRFYHGNFYWQIIPCAWLFFYISLTYLVKDIKTQGFILKNKILLSLYSIHVVIGIIYVIRMIAIGSFG